MQVAALVCAAEVVRMIDLRRECGICHERDIPRAEAVEWLWWKNGAPIHPWCDRAMWERHPFTAKLAQRRMWRELMRQGAE